MDIHEFVQNGRIFKILGIDYLLRFCEVCVKIIKRFEK